MLTPVQQRILQKAPNVPTTHIETFDIRTREAAYRLLDDLTRLCPTCSIHYLGSTKLGISGSNKIDICIIAHDQRQQVEQGLEGLFGLSQEGEYYPTERKWEVSRNGFPMIIRLVTEASDELNEHLDIQRILEARGDLRDQYARLKAEGKAMPLKEYLIKKYEFFNSILTPRA